MTFTQSQTPASGLKVRSLALMLVSSLALVACASTKTATPPIAETTAPVTTANSEAAPTIAQEAPATSAPVASAPLPAVPVSGNTTYADTASERESLSPYASLAEAGERIFFPTDRLGRKYAHRLRPKRHRVRGFPVHWQCQHRSCCR